MIFLGLYSQSKWSKGSPDLVVDLPSPFFASCLEWEDFVREDKRKRKKAKHLAEPFLVELSKPKEHVQNDNHSIIYFNVSPSKHQCENNIKDLGSEVLEGSDVTNRL
ncbi:hypothetical protein CQW23_06176 [Capsicum baccatum]|uniref:Uncharacterized protein n=1 Tax=Capsicum baccatum TaxID=33114 RepID=A0A2G2X2J6_CAPBA|nr:hypothetical protein CQW23_06176 [Capsicum baccatum]